MKISSLAIWIFILYIIQNTFCPIIGITDLTPELMFAFAAVYAVFEHRFSRLSKVIIICAVLSATGISRSFSVVTLIIGIGSIASYLSVNCWRFIPQIIRTQFVVAIFSFMMCVAETFVFTGQLTREFFVDTAIWYTVYTTAISCVIYAIMKKLIFKKKETKLLIAQERN